MHSHFSLPCDSRKALKLEIIASKFPTSTGDVNQNYQTFLSQLATVLNMLCLVLHNMKVDTDISAYFYFIFCQRMPATCTVPDTPPPQN